MRLLRLRERNGKGPGIRRMREGVMGEQVWVLEAHLIIRRFQVGWNMD